MAKEVTAESVVYPMHGRKKAFHVPDKFKPEIVREYDCGRIVALLRKYQLREPGHERFTQNRMYETGDYAEWPVGLLAWPRSYLGGIRILNINVHPIEELDALIEEQHEAIQEQR